MWDQTNGREDDVPDYDSRYKEALEQEYIEAAEAAKAEEDWATWDARAADYWDERNYVERMSGGTVGSL